MSAAADALPGASPVVNQAFEPAWVRHGSTAVQKEYAVGQQFEQMLVAQLAKSFTETAGLSGEGTEGEGGSQAGEGVLSSMLPQALASGVANDGGLGLAAELTRQLQGVAGETSASSTLPAGTSAPGTAPSGGTEAHSGAES